MRYSVRYSKEAEKFLKKMDKHDANELYGWIDKHLKQATDPRETGKPLLANRSGQWRYRVGNYRLIAEIKESELIIHIVKVGHRKDIYN